MCRQSFQGEKKGRSLRINGRRLQPPFEVIRVSCVGRRAEGTKTQCDSPTSLPIRTKVPTSGRGTFQNVLVSLSLNVFLRDGSPRKETLPEVPTYRFQLRSPVPQKSVGRPDVNDQNYCVSYPGEKRSGYICTFPGRPVEDGSSVVEGCRLGWTKENNDLHCSPHLSKPTQGSRVSHTRAYTHTHTHKRTCIHTHSSPLCVDVETGPSFWS